MAQPEYPLPLPRSRDEIAAIWRERLPIAVERARLSRFFAGRLDHVDTARLDDPEEWREIPILTKDELRQLPAETFHEDFCIAGRDAVVEYWRSGGVTGKPLFYPRSAADMRYGMEGFRRLQTAAGCGPGDLVHVCFPLGIHPVGLAYARAAQQLGMGVVTCGSGNNTPTALQLELIRTLRPTVIAGMASYALQLAQHAQRLGIDLAAGPVRKILTAAEPVSPGKRERLERLWGAELYDQFGVTEGSAMASESERHDGMHIWTDQYFVEVVDADSGRPVPDGEMGLLVVTPLWNNTMTPFLRWETGDYVRLVERGETDGPFGVFPMIRHAARTAGFFKVRGININQADIEDFLYCRPAIADFKIEAVETETLDALRISIELAAGADAEDTGAELAGSVRQVFELTPEIEVIPPGTLEREFAGAVKQNRFVDRRGTPD